ncbi:hypothetical protein RYX36_017129 [Vicia faba]
MLDDELSQPYDKSQSHESAFVNCGGGSGSALKLVESTPKKTLLIKAETNMLLMSLLNESKLRSTGLHQFDIETGKVVEEWKFGNEDSIIGFISTTIVSYVNYDWNTIRIIELLIKYQSQCNHLHLYNYAQKMFTERRVFYKSNHNITPLTSINIKMVNLFRSDLMS